MAMKAKPRMERLTGMVPEADAKAFRRLADENGRSVASELRFAVEGHLKQNGRRA